ncbi:ATP-binding protein [Streptomyces syringium]|uniref:wHTH domain-containing protein n=1 Tax=Streptomyces syringium TaxID=76729 RepID=UPI003662EA22
MRQDGTCNGVWGSTVGTLVQAGTVNFHGCPDGLAPAPADPWVESAWDSTVWQHVPAGRNADFFRQHVAEAVATLPRWREAAESGTTADPWRDDGFVPRFAEAVEWLLGEPDPGRPLDLYPAEAALLVLMPFLHRVQCLRLTSSLAPVVEPGRLGRITGAPPLRTAFEVFSEGHDLLVERGRRRPEAAEPIGWWLFHRWLAQREEFSDPVVVQQLLRAVGPSAEALGETLDPRRVCRLLHGLRRGPGVCDREYLDSLPADDSARIRRGGQQRIRDQRIGLLLALAHGMSRGITALPRIVVEHVGIPFPVDLGQLRQTLASSGWGGSHDLPVLRAECRHEAVIEGLREYTAHADELLAAVRRTAHERVTQPMPRLPARLSADEVLPSEGAFTGWAAFRLDERRVRDLLMGIQLYKDRDLAVRELYQNALDACRYRRARTQYLDRTREASYAYAGRIDFEQGTDEDGREYVECRDNGVGMGESELRGVFCRAGSRFVEQLDFTLERATWAQARPPVVFHPNSRFGIGVLSYFMLADEMRVRTCRMDATGELGPLLEARVFGPGHLFRIVRLRERGQEAGTRVRLYVRKQETPWSCLDVLERVLGIAEFPTEVTHGSRRARWEAHRLKTRKAPAAERFGLDAHGVSQPWRRAPDGLQLTWCEYGGALLVDGLVVEPGTRRGVLSSSPSGLTGAVINLTGALAPERLSADRRTLLDDVSDRLRKVFERAAAALFAGGGALPGYAWICRVAEKSMVLGDLLTTAAVGADVRMEFADRKFDVARTGCFLADSKVLPAELFGGGGGGSRWLSDPWKSPRGHPPDHILLWRLLAHRPHALLAQLAESCPEITEVKAVLPALPSDRDLLSAPGLESGELFWNWSMDSRYIAGHLRSVADTWGAALPALVHRARSLGALPRHAPAKFAELMEEMGESASGSAASIASEWRRCGIDVPETYVELATAATRDPLLQRNLGGGEGAFGWVDPEETVPPGHVAKAGLLLGLPVSAVCARLREYGLRVDAEGLPERPGAEVATLLSERADGLWPWLSRSEEIRPGHVAAAARALALGPREVLDRLAGLGFTTPTTVPGDAEPDDADFLRSASHWPLPLHEPVPYAHLFDAARRRNCSLRHVIDRMRAYGFTVPLRPPRYFTPLDKELLRGDGPLEWAGVTTADAMPSAHVLVAARSLLMSPRALAERLIGYGVEVSCPDVPQGLSFASALELLRISEGEDMFLTIDCDVDLYDLIERSRTMKTSITRTVQWLQELGIPVPDLSQTLRSALGRVPGRVGGS